MSDVPKSKVFTPKDYLTITISVVALVISATSFYFNNIRVEDHLQARIIDASIIRTGNETATRDTVVVYLAYVNSGNRQATILKPWYHLADTNNDINGAVGAPFENIESFYMVLQPRETKIVEAKIPFESITEQRAIENDNGSKDYVSFLKIQYFGLTSKGETLNEYSDYQVQIFLDSNGISAVIPVNRKNYNSYQLVTIFKK
jgi:hypothetical protein